MEKYLYTVNPRVPIRNLIKGKVIIRETNLQLDLDEVKICLKHGPVYRKFANNANTSIQVNLENCERLHQRDYIDTLEEQRSPLIPLVDEVKEEEPVVEPEVIAPVEEIEEVAEVVENVPSEDIKEEPVSVVENVEKEDEKENETSEEPTVEPSEEVEKVEEDTNSVAEETTEEEKEVVVSAPQKKYTANPNYKNYNNKKYKK